MPLNRDHFIAKNVMWAGLRNLHGQLTVHEFVFTPLSLLPRFQAAEKHSVGLESRLLFTVIIMPRLHMRSEVYGSVFVSVQLLNDK